ncbi:MAG: TolC family protein [Chryseolinea sp.]
MKTEFKYVALAFLLVGQAAPLIGQQVLSLQQAVEIASENNPELQATGLEVDKSRQQQVIARSALLPAIQASAQVNHFFSLPPFFGFGEATSDEKIPYGRFGGEDQLNTYISAVQPIYNAQAYPGLKKAGLQIEESRLEAAAKRSEIVYLVKQTYLQTLVLNEQIKLQLENVKRNVRGLQDSRSLFLQGKGLRVDTLRAYTAVKNLEPDLMKLNFALQTSKLNLKALLGIDSLKSVELTDSLFIVDQSPIPGEADVYRAAKDNNPAYRLLEMQRQLSEQDVTLAAAARMPSVAAIAQYQLQSQTNGFEYGNAHYPSSSFVGLQVSLPLFTGLSNQAKVRQANLSKTQTSLRANYAYDELRAAVHHAVSSSEESQARLETTASVAETARLSYGITEYRYKRGISSRLELSDASLELSSAQSNFLEAVYDYLISRISLQHLMGQ